MSTLRTVPVSPHHTCASFSSFYLHRPHLYCQLYIVLDVSDSKLLLPTPWHRISCVMINEPLNDPSGLGPWQLSGYKKVQFFVFFCLSARLFSPLILALR